MRLTRVGPAIAAIIVAVTAMQIRGESLQQPKTIGRIVKADARLDQILAPDTALEVLGTGFDWSEGPVWVPRDGGFLLFSDIPPNSIMGTVRQKSSSRTSAGLLMFRQRAGTLEVFLVHPGGPYFRNKDEGAWPPSQE